jgi:hypothetical protein
MRAMLTLPVAAVNEVATDALQKKREAVHRPLFFVFLLGKFGLRFAASRRLRQKSERMSSFSPSLLLKFVNPIGDCAHHFTRCLASGICFGLRRYTRLFTLLDDSNDFLV